MFMTNKDVTQRDITEEKIKRYLNNTNYSQTGDTMIGRAKVVRGLIRRALARDPRSGNFFDPCSSSVSGPILYREPAWGTKGGAASRIRK